MLRITINLEVMSRIEAQQNETFRGWYEMQRWHTTHVKINGSITLFNTIGHSKPAKPSAIVVFETILELFSCLRARDAIKLKF